MIIAIDLVVFYPLFGAGRGRNTFIWSICQIMAGIFYFVTIFIFLINNPLSPKSDQHQILFCNNYMLCKIMEKITDMITRDEFAWYLILLPTTSVGNE